MMAHRAVAVANEFLSQPGGFETITQMKLQKLCYFAHGWNLAINKEPLISNPAQAWDYGPVYKDLYDHTKYFGKEPIGRLISPDDSDLIRFFDSNIRPSPYYADLTSREKAVIEQVWNRYAKLGAIRLSELTHQSGTPWHYTYTNKGRNAEIDDELIKQHYEHLAAKASVTAA
jgi:uncharacterized phage-associated protein